MSKQADRMSIGTLAKTAAVNVETIRFYQRKGLLVKLKGRHSEIRRYTDEDLNRVQFVKAAKALGFTLNEIGALLKLEDGTHCNEVRVIAEQKLADVREKLNQLQRMESTLQRVVVDCQTTNKKVCCPLIASLQVNH
jgi:MerR family mercuric resistance operon transcriptional regulator